MSNQTTILNDVKRMLGIDSEITEFDLDIRSHINSAFFSLYQLGIGPSTPFTISVDTTWDSLSTVIPKDTILDYLYLKVSLIFDPPDKTNVMDAYKDRISELEFRMNIEVDDGGGNVTG